MNEFYNFDISTKTRHSGIHSGKPYYQAILITETLTQNKSLELLLPTTSDHY